MLHRGKVLTIDPDQVNRTALVAPGLFLGQHPAYRLCRIGKFYMGNGHAIARGDLITDPVDIVIDPRLPAPGIPVNRLSLCSRFHGIPIRRIGSGSNLQWQNGGNQERQAGFDEWRHGYGFMRKMTAARRC